MLLAKRNRDKRSVRAVGWRVAVWFWVREIGAHWGGGVGGDGGPDRALLKDTQEAQGNHISPCWLIRAQQNTPRGHFKGTLGQTVKGRGWQGLPWGILYHEKRAIKQTEELTPSGGKMQANRRGDASF